MRTENAKELAMATLTYGTELQLAGEELLGLADIRGARVRCVEGSVWLTLERDLRDIFLNAGESFVVDRDGLTLLHALAPARLRVEVAGDAARLAARGGRPLAAARWLRRVLAAVAPARLAGA